MLMSGEAFIGAFSEFINKTLVINIALMSDEQKIIK